MSQSGNSEHVNLLRAAIAKIEAGAGFAATAAGRSAPAALGERLAIDVALGGGLTRGTLSEVVPARPGDAAAVCAFALALAARLARQGCHAGQNPRSILWIIEDFVGVEHGVPYGPGLVQLGIAPQNLVLVHVPRVQDALWALEEALKTPHIIVIGELWTHQKPYDLAASRRLALAARGSGTPGLIMPYGGDQTASAATTRFEIASYAARHMMPLPLPGPPCWSVRLTKARAGPATRFGLDRDKIHILTWDLAKGCFCDALPVPAPAYPANRPHFAPDAGERHAKAG